MANGIVSVRPPRLVVKLALALMLGATVSLDTRSATSANTRLDGLNVMAALGHPFGSASAKDALADAKRIGARAIAVVPFLWQPSPASPDLSRKGDMTDAELHSAIRDAHELGLAVLVKPHVVMPDHWAGAVAMGSAEDWTAWFANYRRELVRIASIAEEEKAEALAIGTELERTSQRPEWHDLIGAVRGEFSGRLLYVAHNIEEAERVRFWNELDAIGVTLYPPLGADNERDKRRRIMRAAADRLDALAARTKKSVVVGEIGLRSVEGAAARPWESVYEHTGNPDPALQAAVLADWLAALDRPAITGILIWCWFTDPYAGGLKDTDFTIQGKPAERVVMCAWARECQEESASVR